MINKNFMFLLKIKVMNQFNFQQILEAKKLAGCILSKK